MNNYQFSYFVTRYVLLFLLGVTSFVQAFTFFSGTETVVEVRLWRGWWYFLTVIVAATWVTYLSRLTWEFSRLYKKSKGPCIQRSKDTCMLMFSNTPRQAQTRTDNRGKLYKTLEKVLSPEEREEILIERALSDFESFAGISVGLVNIVHLGLEIALSTVLDQRNLYLLLAIHVVMTWAYVQLAFVLDADNWEVEHSDNSAPKLDIQELIKATVV